MEYAETIRQYALPVLEYGITLALALSILSVVVVKCIPSLNVLLLYGKTATAVAPSDDKDSKTKATASTPTSPYAYIVSQLTKLRVPKSWFLHFYVVYFTLLGGGGIALVVLQNHAHDIGASPITSGTTASHIYKLLLLQSFRRLLESIYITKFNPTAKINVAHYLAGMIFYTTISVNTFIDLYTTSKTPAAQPESFSAVSAALTSIFAIASFDQFYNHYYLSVLVKYTIPTRGLFSMLAAPHYLDEVIIYLVIALLSTFGAQSAPVVRANYWMSFAFVLTNLTISALESYKYYERLSHKKSWAIIPGVI